MIWTTNVVMNWINLRLAVPSPFAGFYPNQWQEEGLLYPHEPGSDKIPQINVDIHRNTSHSLPDSCCSIRI